MNIFIIHSGRNLDNAKGIKRQLIEKSSKANVLVLEYKYPFWKKEALRIMQSANMILYVVSEDSHASKNIDWELKQAIKLRKNITLLRESDYKINNVLYERDPFTQDQILIGDEKHSVDEIVTIISEYESSKQINECLFNGKMEDSIDNRHSDQIFEQYKMFTKTSEELVDRRQSVNSFYITANTALTTIAATVIKVGSGIDWVSLAVVIMLTIPGLLLNISWRKLLESYGITNSSKLKIISLLEKRLDASIYDAEWIAMSNKYNKKPYLSFTDSEKRLPTIFIVFYVIVDLLCVIGIVHFWLMARFNFCVVL